MILNRDTYDRHVKNYRNANYSKISQLDDDNDDEENYLQNNKSKIKSKNNNNKKTHIIKYIKQNLLNKEVITIIILILVIILYLQIKSNKEPTSQQLVNNNLIGNNASQRNNDILNELYGTNKTNETSENKNITNKLNTIDEEKEKLNKIKKELLNMYEQVGIVNIINFYEKYINNNSYSLPDLNNFNNIHINIGFTNDNINLIIKHISSILYKASPKTFLHIHMMDAGHFDYDTMIKIKNMIYKINNSTEIIVYNATQVLTDFYIRADSVSKFSQEYAKLYAFKILKGVAKIIFIDGDDCIVQKDLYELYDLNMDNIYARGITEEPSIRYSMNWLDKYLYDKNHYINGGVMIINLELCQKEDFYEKAVKLNNDIFYTKTEEPLQDIINVLLRKKIDFFHPKYNKINFYENTEDKNDESKWYWWMDQTLKIGSRNNHFYSKEELIEADNDPVIIHYAWDRYLQKTIKKYEEDKQFYANLTGID